MRRAESVLQVLSEHAGFASRTVVDVGCGPGDLARALAAQGAHVVGLDRPAMLALARSKPAVGNERYVAAGGEAVPLRSGCADVVVYAASLHHVPGPRMGEAVAECRRLLRPGGRAVFVEPVAEPGSYFEVVRLIEDEREVQRLAQEALAGVGKAGLRSVAQEGFYLERSFEDYVHLLEVNVEDTARRAEAAGKARDVAARMAAEAGVPFGDFRFRSVCRLDVLEVPVG